MSITVTFPFAIGDRVRIKTSGEEGAVRGLSFHASGTQSANVHYLAGDGRAVETWWETDLLEVA